MYILNLPATTLLPATHHIYRVMANWFDGSHDGMIFGLWGSCQCIGNIMGSAYCNIVDNQNLSIQWNYWIPAAQALVVGIIIFLFVPTYPKRYRPLSSLGLSARSNHTNISFKHNTMSRQRTNPIQNTNTNGVKHANHSNGHHFTISNADASGTNMCMSILMEEPMGTFDGKKEEHVGIIDALMIPNILLFGLIFACIKGVNYTLMFWVKSKYFRSDYLCR